MDKRLLWISVAAVIILFLKGVQEGFQWNTRSNAYIRLKQLLHAQAMSQRPTKHRTQQTQQTTRPSYTPPRRVSHPIFNTPITQPSPSSSSQLRPAQGLPLGHAFGQPGTGIIPGSSISGLQQQYRNIFTPRPTATISGQQQRSQHLYGPTGSPSSGVQGLGQTGWPYRQHP